MKRSHSTWMGLLLAGALACGGGSGETTETGGEETAGGEDLAAYEGPISGDPTAGGDVFANLCAGCHEGGAPDLHEHGHHDSPAEIRSLVRNGRGHMPAFGADVLSDADLENVMAHLQSNFGLFSGE